MMALIYEREPIHSVFVKDADLVRLAIRKILFRQFPSLADLESNELKVKENINKLTNALPTFGCPQNW